MYRFKKLKVPMGQGPPQNSKELIAKAFMMCCVCSKSLIDLSKRVYTCSSYTDKQIQEGDAIYWCKDCKETTEHDFKRIKLRGHLLPNEQGANSDKQAKSRLLLDNLFEDYHK
jgi:hypothetical protein